MSVVYFDQTKQMLEDMKNSEDADNSVMAAVIIINDRGEIISAISADDESPLPYHMVGALEHLKRRVMSNYLEKPDGL